LCAYVQYARRFVSCSFLRVYSASVYTFFDFSIIFVRARRLEAFSGVVRESYEASRFGGGDVCPYDTGGWASLNESG